MGDRVALPRGTLLTASRPCDCWQPLLPLSRTAPWVALLVPGGAGGSGGPGLAGVSLPCRAPAAGAASILPSVLPSVLSRRWQATGGGSLLHTQLYSVLHFFEFGL